MSKKPMMLGLALALAAVAAVAAAPGLYAQPAADPEYAAYIAQRKERAAQTLARRLSGIEQRFAEAESFRAKQKDERIAFEKKVAREEAAFLDSLAAMTPQQRVQAWPGFYAKTGQQRAEFSEQLHQESESFWQARRAAWAAGPAAPTAPAATPAK